jgi:hypothetical protein
VQHLVVILQPRGVEVIQRFARVLALLDAA